MKQIGQFQTIISPDIAEEGEITYMFISQDI
jgi:hypothetical protein